MKGEVGEKGVKATEQDYKDLQEFIDSKNKIIQLKLKSYNFSTKFESSDEYVFHLDNKEKLIEFVEKLEAFLQENTSIDFGEDFWK